MNNYRLKTFFAFFAVTAFVTALFIEPKAAADGVRGGLAICAHTVIPTLFPFMAAADFTVRSGLSEIIGKVSAPFTQKFFRLPGSASCAVFMSLVGGFPVGARMTAQLIETSCVSKSQGRRMMLFCVNGGPAFVIGAVGAEMLSSVKAGVLIYIALVCASLTVGFLLRFTAKEEKNEETRPVALFDGYAISESVRQTVQAMLGICAWILLFDCIVSFADRFIKNEVLSSLFGMLAEVTAGSAAAAKKLPSFMTAAVVGWSGLAIHCQIFPYLKTAELKLRTFWLFRFVNAVLAAAFAWLLFKIFPCDVGAFVSNTEFLPRAFSVSAPAAAAMLAMACLSLLDLAKKPKV